MPKPKLAGLRIDIETRSGLEIKGHGAYVYSEDKGHETLIIGYAPIREFAGGARQMGQPRVLDLTDQNSIDRFANLLVDPKIEKQAYNANFERVCLSRWIGLPFDQFIDPKNWHCTAVRANVNGVFGTLDEVAKVLRSPVRKDREGMRLIRLFSKKDVKAKRFHEEASCWCGANHERDFEKFKTYCLGDVLTEAGVAALLPDVPKSVQREYEADQRVNDRGFLHDEALSLAAVEAVAAEQQRLMGKLKKLTGVENPNSGPQMGAWLASQGYPMLSLDKAARAEALDDPAIPPKVAKALVLKGSASLSSVSKHKAALATRCKDGRIRGSLQFYGAHTGREAGRGIQPQNLPRYEASAADRVLLISGKAKRAAPEIAKGSVRASLIPARDHVFVVPDYNAIEARCLGWAAEETWVEDEFRGEGKIYEATASTMFNLVKAEITKAREKCHECGKCWACEARSKGKVSNLALGYGGGAGALVTMGAEAAGINVGNYDLLHAEWEAVGKPGKFHEWERDRHDYPELIRLRDLYRDASPATVRFWKQCAQAWDRAALQGKPVQFGQHQLITMMRDGRHNRLVLPSGRSIWYRFARSILDENSVDRVDRRTFIGKSQNVGHTRVDTHGGKLTENVTQAIARDVLFDLIMKVEKKHKKGWPGRLVLHVHDEVVLEVHKKHADQVLADTLGLMAIPPDWAPGLQVKGAGKIMERYGK